MKVNRNNWIVRFAFAGNIHLVNNFNEITHTTLCALFWRVVVHAFVIALVAWFFGVLLAKWIVEFMAGNVVVAMIPFIIASLVLILIGFCSGLEIVVNRAAKTIVIEAIKKRFCPVVYFDSGEANS